MLICSLTHTPTIQPVLSLKSHCIFDEKALKTYIETNGKDPINNEIIDIHSDIIPISNESSLLNNNNNNNNNNNSEEITNPIYSSIPTMLSAFQNAWDSLSLELFQLRSELDKTKKELSMALYKHDAAVKVAINASKERDEARFALTQLINDGNTKINNDDNNIIHVPNLLNNIESDWNDVIIILKNEQEKLLSLHKQENKERKGKSPIYELTNYKIVFDKSKGFTIKKNDELIEININSINNEGIIKHKSGIFELVDLASTDKKLKSISKLNIKLDSEKEIHSFWMTNEPYILSHIPQKGRKKKEDILLPYQIINIRNKESIPIETELTEINKIISHPTLPIFIITWQNEFELFYNNKSMFVQQLNEEIDNIRFHPDGLLIGISYLNNSNIDIYDLSERLIKLNIETNSLKLGDFKFASNGYYLIITSINQLLLFDMRKNNIILQNEISNEQLNEIFVDIYTSIFIYNNNNYAILDKKGKSWISFDKFDLKNGKIVGILNDNSIIISDNEGIYKANIVN
jgi:pre-mRNA-processing factor 19